MENLAGLWEQFSLSEEEGSLFKSEAMEGGSGCVVAAKFFTHRALSYAMQFQERFSGSP